MKYVLITVLFCLTIQLAKSQSPTFTFSVSQSAQVGFNLLDTIYSKVYHFDGIDTATTSRLHIKMGTTSGGTEVFDHIIDFDPTAALPVGFNYSRVGNDISLTVGVYHMGFFYYEAKIENASGVFSTVETEDSSTHL